MSFTYLTSLQNCKGSNSTGYDDINSKFLQKCKKKIAPHITHLINTIILTQNFPKILKVSRILPINKPQLDRSDIMSYRPINNLSCVEKVIEAYFLHHLQKFQEKNSLFHKNLHGGRKKHSTVTAITQIYDKLYFNENK